YYVGTSNAPWTGGFSTTFTYRRLSLNIVGNFSLGGKVINDITCPVSYAYVGDGSGNEPIQSSLNDLYVNHLNVTRDVTHRWTVANPVTDGYPRLIDAWGERLTDASGNYLNRTQPYSSTIANCLLLENVSYLKLSSISLSYSLPDRWVNAMKMGSMSVSFLMNNLFILTNYSGIDPETPGAVYPQSRSFTFSLNLSF
ncbi:MAG: TonB-dependent receptor, partial [Bacteroidales bacterium]|nr:TonB-dependent receptor [Bacteroidales bacterium]